MSEEQVRKIIQEELAKIIKIDRFVFDKLVQILDARNIQLGRTTGTQIGTDTDQKLAFWGQTPITKLATVTDPNNQTINYVQADVQSIVTAVNAIIDRLQLIGLMQ